MGEEAAERTIEFRRDAWEAGSPLADQKASTFRLRRAHGQERGSDQERARPPVPLTRSGPDPESGVLVEGSRRPLGPCPR